MTYLWIIRRKRIEGAKNEKISFQVSWISQQLENEIILYEIKINWKYFPV